MLQATESCSLSPSLDRVGLGGPWISRPQPQRFFCDSWGETALIVAARLGHVSACKLLATRLRLVIAYWSVRRSIIWKFRTVLTIATVAAWCWLKDKGFTAKSQDWRFAAILPLATWHFYAFLVGNLAIWSKLSTSWCLYDPILAASEISCHQVTGRWPMPKTWHNFFNQVFGALDQRKPISDWFKFLTGNCPGLQLPRFLWWEAAMLLLLFENDGEPQDPTV